jgi:hypothetical protein
MDNAEQPITIDAIAREAGSRSWLHSQPDLRIEIERLRDRQRPAAGRLVPDRQRGSDASLLRRVQVATQRVRTLETDNKRLAKLSPKPRREPRRTLPPTTARPAKTTSSPSIGAC